MITGLTNEIRMQVAAYLGSEWTEHSGDPEQFPTGIPNDNTSRVWAFAFGGDSSFQPDRQPGQFQTRGRWVLKWVMPIHREQAGTSRRAASVAELEALSAICSCLTVGVQLHIERSTWTGTSKITGEIRGVIDFAWSVLPIMSEPPVLSGTENVGNTLTITPGRYLQYGLERAYRWYRGDELITGESGLEYTVAVEDIGLALKGAEYITSSSGSREFETSSTEPAYAASSLGELKIAVVAPASMHSAELPETYIAPDEYRASHTEELTDRATALTSGYGPEIGVIAAAAGLGRVTKVTRTTVGRVSAIATIADERAIRSASPELFQISPWAQPEADTVEATDITTVFGTHQLSQFDRSSRGKWVAQDDQVRLRTRHPVGGYGYNASGLNFRRQIESAPTTFAMSYDMKPVAGFVLRSAAAGTNGWKMPGPGGAVIASGGTPADGTYAGGLSLRDTGKSEEEDKVTPLPDGKYRLETYEYSAEQTDGTWQPGDPEVYGKKTSFDDPATGVRYLFDVNRAYRVVKYYTHNTVNAPYDFGSGSSDGICRIYVADLDDPNADGSLNYILVTERTDVRYSDEQQSFATLIHNNHQGGGASFAPQDEGEWDFWNWHVSDVEIKPDGPPQSLAYFPTLPIDGSYQTATQDMCDGLRRKYGDSFVIVLVDLDETTAVINAIIAAGDGLIGTADCTALDLSNAADTATAGELAYVAVEQLEQARAATADRILNAGISATSEALEGVELSWSSGATLGTPAIAYQIRRNGLEIAGADSRTYTPTAEDIGAVLTMSATDGTNTYTSPGTKVVKARLKAARFVRGGKYLKGPVPVVSDFTYMGWMKGRDFAAAGNNLFAAQTDPTSGFFLTVHSDPQRMAGRIRPNTSNLTEDIGDVVDVWTHFAWRFNNTTKNLQQYVNGERIASAVQATTMTSPLASLVIGAREDGDTENNTTTSDADVAQALEYDSLLDEEEIAAVAAGGLPPLGATNTVELTGATLTLPPGWAQAGTGSTAVSLVDGPEIWLTT